MMLDVLFNAIGISGMGCFLWAYAMLQRGRWAYNSYTYLGANLLGSILLLISLVWDWKLAAFLLECAWGIISVWGLATLYRTRRRAS